MPEQINVDDLVEVSYLGKRIIGSVVKTNGSWLTIAINPNKWPYIKIVEKPIGEVRKVNA